MPLTLDNLRTSPDHYLHSFDGEEVIFVPMDRAAYRRSIFLDDRIQPAASGSMRIPVRALAQDGSTAGGALGWIFHIAHCGSTLLARALDELGSALVLREPLALRQAAVAHDADRLELVLHMLAKRYPGEGSTLVKANVPVNFAIDQIAGAMPQAPAIMLYHRLEDYLLALLRSDNHRAWLRRVTAELSPILGDCAHLNDAQLAAALWLAQLRRFGEGLARMSCAATLDAERFFNDPSAVLTHAARLFGRSPSQEAVAAVVAGPLFATYAKNPSVAFSNADRNARRESLREQIAPELAAAQTWLADNGPDHEAIVAALQSRSLSG